MRKLKLLIGIVLGITLLMACTPAVTEPLEPDANLNTGESDPGALEPADDAAQDEPAATPTAENEADQENDEAVDDPTPSPEEIELRETIASSPKPEPIDPVIGGGGAEGDEPAAAPIVGEVPEEILANIMAELGAQVEADQGEMTIRRAEAVVFSDGSLGCPQPGEMYTMALVNGYVVEIEANGQIYDYRVSDNGFFRLCENGRSFVPVVGTPDS